MNTSDLGEVTVGANTTAGSVERITVTAGGMNASGFLPVPIAGQSGEATTQATTAAFNPPAPKIMLGTTCSSGTNAAGTTQNVVIGQRIAFTACIPESVPPSQVLAVYWDPEEPHGTAVGGYYASTERGAVQGVTMLICTAGNPACAYPKFYWLTPGNGRTFTFTYVHGDGVRSATITFNVSGPTNVDIAVTPSPLSRDLIQVVQATPMVLGTDRQVMVFGPNVTGGQQGIKLEASANLPNGNQGEYSWIQLLTTRNIRFSNAEGRWICPLDYSPQHDGFYNPELHKGRKFEDSPWTFLPMSPNREEKQGEVADSFAATAYLMWEPNPASGCDGEDCTILVPLAKVDWSWSGDAINTLIGQGNGTTWVLAGCQSCSNASAQHPSSHPEWVSSMGAPAGCLPRRIQ